MTAPRSNPVLGFFGAMLIGVGALIAVLCGLCTGVFFIGGLFGGRGDMFGGVDIAIMSLFIGGIPTAIGVGLFYGGRAMLRASDPPKPVVRLDEPPSGQAG